MAGVETDLVDSKKVEGVMDGGRNAAWVCCVVVSFIPTSSLVVIGWIR
jgi:hypothetical protein